MKPMTPRQQELIRLIQALSPDARHTIELICRGSEPWEIQEVIEHRRLGEVKPKDSHSARKGATPNPGRGRTGRIGVSGQDEDRGTGPRRLAESS